MPAVIDHLSSSLVRELDFRHEAANIERMREVLAPFSRLSVPEVIADLSARRLLVLQEIQLTAAIGIAGRRIAVGLAAATAIVGTAVTASAAHSAAWATALFGTAAVMLTGGLLIDILRRR